MFQEVVSLLLFQRRETLDGCACAHKSVEETSIFAENVAVRAETESILPAHVFSKHGQDWPVGVDRATLVQKVDGGFVVIYYNDGLAHSLQRHDSSWNESKTSYSVSVENIIALTILITPLSVSEPFLFLREVEDVA